MQKYKNPYNPHKKICTIKLNTYICDQGPTMKLTKIEAA